jgi:hypothetical protein
VKHPQPLIKFNYNSDRPKFRIEHIRRVWDFLCDFVDILNSVYSVHTLILVTFYIVIFIYEGYFGFVAEMGVKSDVFGRIVWVRVTCIETAINAVSFTVLMYALLQQYDLSVNALYVFVLLTVVSWLSDLNLTQ